MATHDSVDPTGPASLGVLLRLLHQQFASGVDQALASAGFADLRSSYASVFTFVPPEGITVSELTGLARVRKQSMTQTVTELEALGYVERKDSPTDKRSRLVFLTPKGKKVRPLAMAAGKEIEATWARCIGPKALESLKLALAGLLARLQAEADGELSSGEAEPARPAARPRRR